MSLDEKQSAYDLAQAGAVFLSPNPFLCLMLNIQWRYVITQSCHWDKGQTNRCMISLASKDLSFVAVASWKSRHNIIHKPSSGQWERHCSQSDWIIWDFSFRSQCIGLDLSTVHAKTATWISSFRVTYWAHLLPWSWEYWVTPRSWANVVREWKWHKRVFIFT